MTSPASIGDLSRAAHLRQANVQLKTRLATLTQEATTGVRADIPAALGGNMGQIAQVEQRLAALAAWRQNAAGAAAELSGLQDAMGAIQDLTTDLGPALLGEITPGDAALDLRAREAGEHLRAVTGYLNVNVGGRYLLSGTAVQTAPLPDAGAILGAARSAIAGQPGTGDMIAALDAWFDAPPGSGGFADMHYAGATAGSTVLAVGERTVVASTANALDPAFRDVLKGLTLAALAGDPDLTRQQKAQLIGAAGQRIVAGNHQLTLLRADVGLTQETVEAAETRNAAQHGALSIARTTLLEADPYETASALTQTESHLQNLYALTARLSRLSLTDYL